MFEAVCDFCSSVSVRWRYPAKTFKVGPITSLGDWAACDPCHVLLGSGDRGALLQRSVTLAPPPLAELPEGLRRAMIAPTHREFFKSQCGAGVPHEEKL